MLTYPKICALSRPVIHWSLHVFSLLLQRLGCGLGLFRRIKFERQANAPGGILLRLLAVAQFPTQLADMLGQRGFSFAIRRGLVKHFKHVRHCMHSSEFNMARM